MNAVIRFKEEILLEYNMELDSYELSTDGGVSFPYEAHENIVLDGEEMYLIYLDAKDQIPITQKDVWIAFDESVLYLNNYRSKTLMGAQNIDKLIYLLTLLDNEGIW